MTGKLLVAIVCLALGFSAGWFWPQSPDRSGGDVRQSAPARVDSGVRAGGSDREANAGERRLAGNAAQTPRVVQVVSSLAETASIDSEFLQSAALYALAAPMGPEGIRSLLDEASRVLIGGDYLGGTALLIGRYAELDFSGALNYAFDNGGPALENWLRSIFHARARIDVDDAVARASELTSRQQRIAGVAILRSNDHLSAAQRRSIIETLKVPDQMVAAAQHTTEAAWEELRSISDPMRRASAQAQVLMRWGQSDPWAALQASEEIESAQMRQTIQGPLLGLAAGDDSQRALDWLNAQPEGDRRNQLTKAVVVQLGVTDPESAQFLLDQLPSVDRLEVEVGLWTQRAASDPEGAAAWVESLPSSDDRSPRSVVGQTASTQILMILGMTSTESAERFMSALPSVRRAELAPTYVQTMAQRDPVAASRWVESQSGDGKSQLYDALGSSWAQQDASAAQDYGQRMRAGSDRDHMLKGILGSGRIGTDNVQSMIDQIDDPQLRAEAEKMQEWRQKVMSGGLGGTSRSYVNGVEVRSSSEGSN